jgi:N6-adenosine-specific RNA methylase IME4
MSVRYPVVYADPPWNFKCYSAKGKARGAEAHYDCMTLDQIKALPVRDLAADDCCLFLWVTNPTLPQAFEVIGAWGFTYKTVAFCWAKTTVRGLRHVGMGYWSRANAELCLLATRGKPKRSAADVRMLVDAPVGQHSEKPEEVRRRIERLVAGPYVELFARRSAPGWETAFSPQVGLLDTGPVRTRRVPSGSSCTPSATAL